MKLQGMMCKSKIIEENESISKDDIIQVLTIIQNHRDNAYRKVNEEQIVAYYKLGRFLSNKLKEEKWGSKTIERLAEEINLAFPEMKSISKRGLYRMIQFYETYAGNEIVSPLVSQISWTNNIVIFSHKSSIEEKEFYLRLCIKNLKYYVEKTLTLCIKIRKLYAERRINYAQI